ncbi:MAG: class I SAM-dependent methyltransferase [Thermoleophilia bacterium]|nr:class I SAM-dependent methyltransferase [Thermoleophilia bacterium]
MVEEAARDPRLKRWLCELTATPGLTAVRDTAAARRQHLADSLAALPVVGRFAGPLVDVGSGGGAPGLPLAAALPDREVTLLEASRRKCDFLREAARDFPNVRVVHGRAEEQPVDTWGVAVAKALAAPPVALEWCLALVRPGGAAVLFVGEDPRLQQVATVAAQLAGGMPELADAGKRRNLVVVRKDGPTPPGFPRRPGVARKRPLA